MVLDKYGRMRKITDENGEYSTQRKQINAEEIGVYLEQQIQARLSPYRNIFEKFEKYSDDLFKIPLKTSLSKEMVKKILADFFHKLNSGLYEQVKEVFDTGEDADFMLSDIVFKMRDDFEEGIGHCSKTEVNEEEFASQLPAKYLEQLKESDPVEYAIIQKMMKPRTIVWLSIAYMGNTSDLYNLAHELTHYFTIKNSNYFGMIEEIAPHCTERLLDEYLLSLTDDECKEFGLNKEQIKEDVILRNIITFAERYNAVKHFNQENTKNGESALKQEYLKYMLALIYQSQFISIDLDSRKEMIVQLIDCVKSGDFDKMNEIFQINWEDTTQRHNYMNKPIEDVLKYFELYQDIIEAQRNKSCNSVDDSEDILL